MKIIHGYGAISKWHKRRKSEDFLPQLFWWCLWSRISLRLHVKKWNAFCNRLVSLWNPDTSKEIVRFVHEVHPVFFVTLSTFKTCYVGEMMIPCQLSTFSEFICSAFQFQGHIAQKISKCMKNTKWSQKGLEIDYVALNGASWTQ